MTTPKQQRNGVPGPGATGGNVSLPGPDATAEIRAVKKTAESAGNARATNDMLTRPQSDAGVRPWDQGLAVNDYEGGGSG